MIEVSGEIQESDGARASYINRRHNIEQSFLNQIPHQEIVEVDNGGKVNVLSSVYEIPKSLRNKRQGKDDEYKVAVYVAGLFQMDRPNTGCHPHGAKLISSIVKGDIDAIMVIKAEGLNANAYLDAYGNNISETEVGKASAIVFHRILDALQEKDSSIKDKKIVVNGTGYSEGSTQVISTMARLAETGVKIEECITMGGAGMMGFDKEEEVDVLHYMKVADTDRKIARKHYLKEPFKELSPDNFWVSWDLVKSYEQSLSPSPTEPEQIIPKQRDDMENILRFVAHFGQSKLKKLIDGGRIGSWISEKLKLKDLIPFERIEAVCKKNPDYEKLVEMGIPITIISETDDMFFSNISVNKRAQELRQKGGRVKVINTNVGHQGMHYYPSGAAYLLEIVDNRTNRQDTPPAPSV